MRDSAAEAEALSIALYGCDRSVAVAGPDTEQTHTLMQSPDPLSAQGASRWWLLVGPDGAVREREPISPDPKAGGAILARIAAGPPPPEARAATNATFCLPPRQSSMRSDATA